MIPVASRKPTDTDLKMNYLILALCISAASAASFGYTPYQPTQQFNRGFTQNAQYNKAQVAPAVVAVGAKNTYNSAYSAAKSTYSSPYNTPQVGAKATYNAAYNTAQVGAKATYNGAYNSAKAVVTAPIVASKATYNAAAAVASAPAQAARETYSAAKAVAAAPALAAKAVYNANKESEAAILNYQSEVNSAGFKYNYETANGISAASSGILRKVDDANVVVVQGRYQYVAPDGQNVVFTYIADENGYQPSSDLLPVGPPIPEDIARSLEYIRAHPSKTENY